MQTALAVDNRDTSVSIGPEELRKNVIFKVTNG